MNKSVFLIFFISMTCFSQNKSSTLVLLDSLNYYLEKREIKNFKKLIDKSKQKKFSLNDRYKIIDNNIYYYHYINKNYDSCIVTLKKINNYSKKLNAKNLNNFYTNKAYLHKKMNQLDSATFYFTKSLNYYELDSLKNKSGKLIIYNGLATIYRLSFNDKKQLFYLEKYLNETIKQNDTSRIDVAYNNLGVYYDTAKKPKEALYNFKNALKFSKNSSYSNNYLQNIGSIYLHYYNNIDSSLYYNKKAINKYTSKRTLAYIHRDLSVIQKRKENFLNENKELKTALKNIKLDPFPELELELYKDLSENNKTLKNYKTALLYLEKYDSLNEIIKNQSQIEKVEDIEIKYQTEKKEKENLQLKQENLETEAKRVKNRNFLIGSLLFILLAGTIGVLTLKNSRRKRILAQQKEELEKQKNLTLLKEQELTTINAMVDGQEKERKRIAEDLHDNLGSVLATLKLHFENLKINRERKKINQEELFDKTEGLIDEAYLKVRSIAHAKNAGVIAKQGLLLAIQMMAEKISSADKIKIEVVDFGLDKRLENSLEITIFRIIQELITNIIKHANAKNATINISLYDKNLNIIIEDDGKGFIIKNVNLKNGMGISSIKTRVEHLKGTFEIDSSIGKGSSVIIDIPIS